MNWVNHFCRYLLIQVETQLSENSMPKKWKAAAEKMQCEYFPGLISPCRAVALSHLQEQIIRGCWELTESAQGQQPMLASPRAVTQTGAERAAAAPCRWGAQGHTFLPQKAKITQRGLPSPSLGAERMAAMLWGLPQQAGWGSQGVTCCVGSWLSAINYNNLFPLAPIAAPPPSLSP